MSPVLVALLREWHVGLKSPRAIINHLLSPVMYLLIFAPSMAATLPAIAWRGESMPYLAYVVPGLMAVTSVSIGNGVGVSIYIDKLTGELEMLLGLPIHRFVLIVGLCGNAALRAGAVGAIIWGMVAFTAPEMLGGGPAGVAGSLLVVMVSAVAWTLLSVVLACRIRSQENFNLAVNLLGLPIMLTSLVFYNPAQGLAATRWLAQVNPLSFASDIIRMFAAGRAPLWTDVLGLALFLVVMLCLAVLSINTAIE